MRPRTNLRSAPVGGGRHGPPLTRLRSGAALQGAKPTTTHGVAIRLCPQGRDVQGNVPGNGGRHAGTDDEGDCGGAAGLYEQDGAEDPTVYVHYFSCVNGWDWWLLEFDGTDEAFGLVEGYDDELAYFSIKEMEELNRQMGFAAVERDEHFEPKPLSAVRGR